jgi:hypothetical protein
MVSVTDADMMDLRKSYLKNALKKLKENIVKQIDIQFLSKETKLSEDEIMGILKENSIEVDRE